jgi:enterochelin esterase-like enzyme/outer membrane protein assembly factor BamB
MRNGVKATDTELPDEPPIIYAARAENGARISALPKERPMAERSGHARLPLVAVFLGIACAAPAAADEWPGLRGPNHDGSARRGSRFGAGPGAPVVRWRVRLGSGYAGVAVSGGRAVTMFSDGGDDVLAAFDEASGKELWRIRIAERHKGMSGSFDGPISTPTIAGGRVFALGPAGHLLAADLAKGRLLWRVDLPVREGARKPELGFASSPVVAGGVLVVQIGAALGRAIAGFDPSTGQRRWTVGDDAVQYQSPVVVRVGERGIVVAVGDARLIGIDPATGRVFFDHPHGGEPVWISVASAVPMPAGNGRLFVKTHVDKSTMYRLVEAADGRISLETLWTAPVLRQTYAVPVYHDGHLYGMNGRTVLTCVDAETGELQWRTREPGDGFPTLVGDQIVFVTKAHTLHVGPASPQGWKESARLELFDDLSWTAPTVAGDSVFARSLGELARVDWNTEPASTTATATPAGPTIASPTLARFLEELERAPDKAAAVDRFLAGVGGGPLIDPPDRVVFLYRGPAKDVAIASDLLGIRREDPLHRVPGTDLFHYEAQVEPASRVSYQFIPDFGRRVPDTRNPRRVPGAGPNEEASSLAMPGWVEPAHLADPREGRRGRMEKIEFASSLRQGAKATLHVYLPAGYDRGSDRYPVAYVLDGDGARAQGLVPRSLDNLIPERVAPALVVFHGRMDWGSWKPQPFTGEEMEAQLEVLAKEIVPLIDTRFRTIAEPGARAVVGQAFDAVTAIGAAFAEPGLFGALGVQSAFLLDVIENALKPQLRTASERPLRVYHDWGLYGHASTREARDLRAANRRFNEYLRSKGYQTAGGEAKDGDGWASWRNRTDRLFAALFPPAAGEPR